MKRQTGFTLIETVIVIAIIGVLLGLIVPSASGITNSAKQTTCDANRENLKLYLQQAYIYHNDLDEVFNEQVARCHCPFGGTYSYTVTDGVITVLCSHNDNTGGGGTTSQKVASAATAFADLYDGEGLTMKIHSTALSDPNSNAFRLYNQLTSEQQQLLDQYMWTVVPYQGKFRIYLAAKDTVSTTGNFPIYKYDPERNQFQYSANGTLYSSGSAIGALSPDKVLSNTNDTRSWGAYDENGQFIVNGWSDEMTAQP